MERMEVEKAHALANCIAEAEELGMFDRMDKRTREDIEYAHLTANIVRAQEAS